MRMSNRWNLFVYRLWAPVYDATVGHLFMPGGMYRILLIRKAATATAAPQGMTGV